MELTRRQKQSFHDQGYLVIPGVAPRVMVDAALHAINHSLGQEGMNKEELPVLRSRSYCREIQKEPAITDLLNKTPLFPLVESLVGAGNLLPVSAGQIALRFPNPLYTDAGEPRGHLDGLGTGLNGLDPGSYSRSFSALAVILLSDLPEPDSGNFTVWPGTHRFFEEHFREHGHAMLAEGMPKVPIPVAPHQITGRAGDAVIAHHQIVHTAAPNASPHIRYAAIFRLRHVDCEAIGKEAYTDIWREWPGVREAMANAAG
jgi:hypothetical protein